VDCDVRTFHHRIGSVTPLERVQTELLRYDHMLVNFAARERDDGDVELVISLKQEVPGAHTYIAPLHPRDIENAQFAWNLQRYLYDCLHDYQVELFLRTPQSREFNR